MDFKHRETHPELDVEGCFGCKVTTIRSATVGLARERMGTDVTAGRGTTEYVRGMYEKRRADGLPDPIPENSKAARYAPPMGVIRDKKLKGVN
jgi:hypothetical protein